MVTGNSILTIGLVYRSPNINEEGNRKILNAIKEVSKGEFIIMEYFNHEHIQRKSLESTGGEDQQFLLLIQVPYSTRARTNQGRECIRLSFVFKNLVDNIKIHQPLGNSDYNQIHFDIKVKSESTNKKYRRNFHKSKYKDMRQYLAQLDWNNMLRSKTAIECWNVLKYVIESMIDQFAPLKKQGKRLERNICQKKLLEK